MTRESYIEMRKDNSVEMMYEYYLEHFNSSKHSPKLELGEFIEYIMLWPNRQGAFNVATEYYDSKFHVLKVSLEDKMLYL